MRRGCHAGQAGLQRAGRGDLAGHRALRWAAGGGADGGRACVSRRRTAKAAPAIGPAWKQGRVACPIAPIGARARRFVRAHAVLGPLGRCCRDAPIGSLPQRRGLHAGQNENRPPTPTPPLSQAPTCPCSYRPGIKSGEYMAGAWFTCWATCSAPAVRGGGGSMAAGGAPSCLPHVMPVPRGAG